ncbi:MAG: precorrin-6A/cobalt-precorrin-6A reductase [Reinekea sp.]
MTLLVLGGTSQAVRISQALNQADIQLIYSIAGLVRKPTLSCMIISGGFSQYGGLNSFIGNYGITAILDATHPYAVNISQNAVAAAQQNKIPYWQLHRPAWLPQADDHWSFYQDWDELIQALRPKQRLFITTGQLEQKLLQKLVAQSQQLYFRTAVEPGYTIPEAAVWINQIGPFNEAQELNFLTQHRINALISKNSGGDATVAKLTAARKLGIEVFFLQRPELPEADKRFTNVLHCIEFITQQYCDRSRD